MADSEPDQVWSGFGQPPSSPVNRSHSTGEASSAEPTACFSSMELKCVQIPEEQFARKPAQHLVQRCVSGCVELCVANPVLHVDTQLSSMNRREREVLTYGSVCLLQDPNKGTLSLKSAEGPVATLLSAKVANIYWPAFVSAVTQHEIIQDKLGKEIDYPMPLCWQSEKNKERLSRYHNPPELASSSVQAGPRKVIKKQEQLEPQPETRSEQVLSPIAVPFVPAPKPALSTARTFTSTILPPQTFISNPASYSQNPLQPQPTSTPLGVFAPAASLSLPWQPTWTSSAQQVYAQLPTLTQHMQQQQLQLDTQKQLAELRKKVEEKEREDKEREDNRKKEEKEKEGMETEAKRKRVEPPKQVTTPPANKEKSCAQKERDKQQHKSRRQRKRQAEAVARKYGESSQGPMFRPDPHRQFDDEMNYPPYNQYHHPMGCNCPECRPHSWM